MLTSYVAGKTNFKCPEKPQTSYFLSLEDYICFARRAIAKFANPRTARFMLKSDDAVSWVAEAIMLNDWNYDGQGYSRLAIRIRMARWAILNYLREISKEQYTIPLSQLNDYFVSSLLVKKHKNYLNEAKSEFDDKINKESVEYYAQKLNEEIEEDISRVFKSKFDKMIAEANLTERQEQCIRLRFEEDKSESQIAIMLGCSRQNINQCIFNGLYKVKQLYMVA